MNQFNKIMKTIPFPVVLVTFAVIQIVFYTIMAIQGTQDALSGAFPTGKDTVATFLSLLLGYISPAFLLLGLAKIIHIMESKND